MPHLVKALRGAGRPRIGTRATTGGDRTSRSPTELRTTPPRDPERPFVQPSRRHLATCLRDRYSTRARVATWTGSPARRARRRFPTTTGRSTNLAHLCARARSTAAATRRVRPPLRPYKWYVAAYRTDRDDPRWTKAIGVLTERNWWRRPGAFHGPATTVRIRRRKSRCRSPAASRAFCHGARSSQTHRIRNPNDRRARRARATDDVVGGPLVWTFDGPFATCLQDVEDTFRRAIVQIGDVRGIVVQIDLSLPALKPRVDAGEAVQPAWGQFLDRCPERYGLPSAPRVRHVAVGGPLATLVDRLSEVDMTLKGWVLRKVNGPHWIRIAAPATRRAVAARRGRRGGDGAAQCSAGRRRPQHAARVDGDLGAYASADRGDSRGARALRREPPADASRDCGARPLSADVDRGRMRGSDEAREFLRRFVAEFKPEQIKIISRRKSSPA